MGRWAALSRVMYTPRARRVGRREAEQLLSGAPVAADRDELVRMLRLAAAPAHPAELTGRPTTMAAFVRSPYEIVGYRPPVRRQPTLLRALSRALAVKLLAGTAVLVLGGAAVAAGTGSLPAEVQHNAHDLLSPLGVRVPDATVADHRDAARPARSPSPSPTPSASPSPSASTPSPVSLCKAWRASTKTKQPVPMDPSALLSLTDAAGGKAKIAAFCTKILPPSPSKSASRKPSPSPSSRKPKAVGTPSPSRSR
jgi:hypothetical protein